VANPVGVNVPLTARDLDAWIPIRLHVEPDSIDVDWCRVDDLAFTDPFFDQTIEHAMRHPFRQLFQHRTRLADVAALVAARPGLPIAGFVFHLSRSGSTLVAQMLATDERVLVLSEPGPVDTALRTSELDQRVESFRTIVRAMAQPRRAGHEVCVIKLDSWTTLDLPTVRQAFPHVPWVFVHRDPVEVLVSQHAHRGYHMIRAGSLFDMFAASAGDAEPPGDPDEYGAYVLGQVLTAARTNLDTLGAVVDYADLPTAVFDTIAPHFGLDLSTGTRAAMARAATRNAKNPVLEFSATDESNRRRGVAPATIASASARWADGPWAALKTAASPAPRAEADAR